MGPVEAMLTASGTVLPEVEQVLPSPIDARVLRILKRAGSAVKRGEPLLELDLSASKLALGTLERSLALKRNQQQRTELELEGRLIALESQRKIKSLALESLKAQRERKRQLHAAGLVSEEDLRQAELAASQATIEQEQIEAEARNARESTRAQLEGVALETATLRQERDEAARQLELGTAKADRSGVVTWTVDEEGASVHKGDPLARVADLDGFRVDATLSDVHARQLVPGLPAAVKVGEDTLAGTISSVRPTVQNGALTFSVALAERGSPLLRPNLRVDVLVVTGRRERTLRLARGPAIEGEGSQQLYVVRDGQAVRTPVRIGLLAFDVCEVSAGLREGDEVVVSDMNAYRHLASLRIR